MVQLSANRCSCIAILSFSLVSLSAITLCVASQRLFVVVVLVVFLLLFFIRYRLSPETFGYILVCPGAVRGECTGHYCRITGLYNY
jgi:hypothetical protein